MITASDASPTELALETGFSDKSEPNLATVTFTEASEEPSDSKAAAEPTYQEEETDRSSPSGKYSRTTRPLLFSPQYSTRKLHRSKRSSSSVGVSS